MEQSEHSEPGRQKTSLLALATWNTRQLQLWKGKEMQRIPGKLPDSWFCALSGHRRFPPLSWDREGKAKPWQWWEPSNQHPGRGAGTGATGNSGNSAANTKIQPQEPFSFSTRADIPCATLERIKCRLNYTGALHWSSSHKRQLCCFVPDL